MLRAGVKLGFSNSVQEISECEAEMVFLVTLCPIAIAELKLFESTSVLPLLVGNSTWL
jgi:hypothetical protein